MYARIRLLCCCLMIALPATALTAGKPRLIVLTDISNEPDDEESLVRLLVYANEYDLEGLIATTSVWLRDKIRPDLIRRGVEAYGQVRDNLLRHAPGFPGTGDLLARIKSGSTRFGMEGVGEGHTSDGSRHIIEVVDRPDPRPIWVAVWGGANTLAQALWDVKYTRTPEELRRFVARLRVYTISDQDNSGRWLRITFPDLFYIVSPSSVDSREYYLSTWSGISGDRRYQNGPMQDFELVDNPWLIRNVIEGHGPLGALYPKLAYIMEGDTPSFLNLIGNGLAGHVSPDYGGWGGRYELRQSYGETRPIYTNSRDTVMLKDGRSHTSSQATVWRWREAYQHDFAARMDWCALPREKANHPPVAVVNGIPGKDVIETDAQPGQVVRLSAEGSSDPDGDRISCRWFQYPEAGTSRARVELETPATSRTAFAAPAADQPGAVHVILEVRDSGDPALYAYRRVIVRVRSLEAFPGTTPVLDGVLSPGEWDDATIFTGPPNWVPQFSPTTDPKDLSLRGWVKHDGKRLYFGFDVTDDVLYGIDTPRWLPDNNPQAHELTPQGFPWFGDMMELLINAANRWRGEEGARGDGASWQMVCNLTKSRLHGIGTGGLMEGEPRRDPQAWANYQKWILSGAQQAVAKPKSGGRGYVIEWAVSFDPCLEVEPGRFYSTALGDRPMGLNIALGDLDEKERGAGNFGNFHHEDWFSGARNVRTQLRHWGTLWMRAAPR
jgi:hypothetical protein